MMRIGATPDLSAIALSCSLIAARADLVAVEAAQHRHAEPGGWNAASRPRRRRRTAQIHPQFRVPGFRAMVPILSEFQKQKPGAGAPGFKLATVD